MTSPSPHQHDDDPTAYGITTAEGSHLDDIAKRQKQYVATMAFRVVAILVVVFVPGPTLLERVVLGLVATIIPYVAVIRANSGPDQDPAPTNLMIGAPRQPELPAPDLSLPGSRRIDGETVGDPRAARSDADVEDARPRQGFDADSEDLETGGFAADPGYGEPGESADQGGRRPRIVIDGEAVRVVDEAPGGGDSARG